MTVRRGLLLAAVLLAPARAGGQPGPSFEREVAPLLKARCLRCHAGPRPRGDLDLTRHAKLLAGGTNGSVVTSGRPADSRLFALVRDRRMPPKQPLTAGEVELLRRWIAAGAPWSGPALVPPTPAAVGRAGPDWWSLRPIRRPAPPAVTRPGWVRNPIDAFVLAALEARGLTPSPEADRRTLLRRVTFDLTGLPPTPEEVATFLGDARPDAYERLVDRLLASPAYGERWARHWLDVVRFAESHGYEMNTLRPRAWPYRDYVIAACNTDRPFRQLVRDQLAGEGAGRGDPLAGAATGFLVGGAHDMVGNATPEGRLQQRADDLFDMVATTGTAFLGLTVGCARCHDHKFDPITQRDFYGLQAVFAGVQHAEREVPGLFDPQRRRHEADTLRARLARLDRLADEQEPRAATPGKPAGRRGVNPRRNVERFAPVRTRFVRLIVQATTDGTQPCIDELEVYGPDEAAGNLALAARGAKPSASSVYPNSPLHRVEHVNDGRTGNARSWISREPGRGWVRVELPAPALVERVVWGRDRERRYTDRLARTYRVEVSTDGFTWQAVAGSWDRLPPGQPATLAEPAPLRAERERLEKRLSELSAPPRVYAGSFAAPGPTHLLRRGDPMQKGEEVAPAAVAAVRPAFVLRPGAGEAERRRALADWIASPDNPLPARVMVNRVWHWHFGQGLVRTPSDLGFNGDRPSHPALLDWLAAEFLAGGGRLKPLHRLIVRSATYRQASRHRSAAAHVDADNRLLWRYTPRRLEAEAVRDALLCVSGALDRRMGGPGYHLWEYAGYVIVFKPRPVPAPDTFRRMIYQFKPRLQQDPIFGAFDCPDATQPAPRRNVSTTAVQALNLLNDPFVLDQAERFAARLRREAGADPAAQVGRAFRLAFGREPAPREAAAAVALVRAHGLAALGRALFNANEFVFAD